MKKTYEKPEMTAVEIQTEQIIASSGNSPELTNTALGDDQEFD